MKSHTPAQDEIALRAKREKVELCGKNRGPHDYIAIQWVKVNDTESVSRFMCRQCFAHVSVSHLIENYEEVKL